MYDGNILLFLNKNHNSIEYFLIIGNCNTSTIGVMDHDDLIKAEDQRSQNPPMCAVLDCQTGFVIGITKGVEAVGQ